MKEKAEFMEWYPFWSYRFQNYEVLPAKITGLTQVIHVTSCLSGKAVRILLSNKNGREAVVYCEGTLSIDKTPAVPLTVQGRSSVRLNPGEEVWTAPIDMEIRAGDRLEIKWKLEGTFSYYAGLNSNTVFQTDFQNAEGQHIKADCFSRVVEKNFNSWVYFGIRSVEILTDSRPEVITVFGDSLVHQGHWFQEWYRLRMHRGDTVLLNEGISGNRVLRDANSTSTLNPIFGKAGVFRLKEDVFSRYHPDKVILAEGINDLVHPGNGCPLQELPDAEALIWGLQEMCSQVEQENSIPVLATISPFKNYDYIWSAERESIRKKVNNWIRTHERYMDIDAFVRDENERERLKAMYDSGDHLHFNRAAGVEIAKRWEALQ